jgi:hypothetical protein
MHLLQFLLFIPLTAIATALESFDFLSVEEDDPTLFENSPMLFEDDLMLLENSPTLVENDFMPLGDDESFDLSWMDPEPSWTIADMDTSGELEASCLTEETSNLSLWSRKLRPRNGNFCPAPDQFKGKLPNEADIQQKVWDLQDGSTEDDEDDEDDGLPYPPFQDADYCRRTHPYHVCCLYATSDPRRPLMGNPISTYHQCDYGTFPLPGNPSDLFKFLQFKLTFMPIH